jgi:uncharacterized membrane-anchored protein YhcB (DUF1043 family)
LEAAAQQHDKDASFGGYVDSPLLRQKLGIDFNATSDALEARLPTQIRDAVTAAVAASVLNPDSPFEKQQQAVATVLDKFSQQFGDYSKQLVAYGDLLRQQSDQQAREAAREQMSYLQGQVQAGIGIITFVFGHALGDNAKASEVKQVLSGFSTIAFAMATGNVLGAISTGLSLLDGFGSDPMAPVMKMVQQIGQQIEELRTEMRERFDRLEAQQQEMLKQLARIYQAVQEGTAITGGRIDQLQQQFESYWVVADEDNRRKAFAKATEAFSQAMLVRTARAQGWQTTYLDKLPIFVTYATQESRQSYFRGITNPPLGQLATEVTLRRNADQLFGIIPAAASLAGQHVAGDLPNPFTLEVGTEAYLQADLLLGDEAPNVGREGTLQTIWADVTACRSAVACATSATVVQGLASSCMKLGGADVKPQDAGSTTPVGALRTLGERWQSENLKPRYTTEALPDSLFQKPYKELLYGFFEDFRVTNSPLDAAVSLGLLQLTLISDTTKNFIATGRTQSLVYTITVKIGIHANQTFGDVQSQLAYIRDVFLDYPPGESRYWLPPPSSKCPIGNDIHGLLDYCETLLGYYYATQLLAGLPAWLSEHGFDASAFNSWSDTASALRLVATLRQWRLMDGLEVQGQTDVRNIALLCTADDVLSWLRTTIQQDVEKIGADLAVQFWSADPRGNNLHARLGTRINDDVKDIQSRPDSPVFKSLPVIDRLSRKVLGSMRVNKVTPLHA